MESIPHADYDAVLDEQIEYLREHSRKCYRGVFGCSECIRWRRLLDLVIHQGAWKTIRYDQQQTAAKKAKAD